MTSKKPAAKKTARRPSISSASKKATKTPAPAAQKKAAPAAAKPTRAGLAYEMIQKGATNVEVLAALREKFNLPPEHSYYPAWYRARLVMDGVITKEFAAEHRGPAIARKPAAAK